MNKDSKIFIVGHNDISDSSLLEYFLKSGYKNVFSSAKMGMHTTIQSSVYQFFSKEKPDYVFLGSIKSGGIEANQKYAAEFMYDNLETQNHVIYAAQKFGIKKLMYLASSCVYPKACDQPMKEQWIGTGKMEETSEAYSLAKLAGMKLVQMFRRQYGLNAISVIPATIYGPFDGNVDLTTAHVMDALITKFSQAIKDNQKEVVVWGTGRPRREFLFKEDFVNACLFLMEKYDDEAIVNIGAGEDIKIKELAEMISEMVDFKGKIIFDSSKPDGVMKKLLDNGRIKELGWHPKKKLKEGIKQTIENYIHKKNILK